MDKHFHQTAARLGLIKFPTKESFKNRQPSNDGSKNFLIDSRGAGTNIELRNMIINALTEGFYHLPECDIIGGVANSGSHWAATLAYKLNMPFANILKEPRKSGMKRQIEGDIYGKRLLLVDNWMNTGDSLRKATEIVKKSGGISVGLLCIAGKEPILYDMGLPYAFAFSTQLLLEAAADICIIPEELKNDFLTIK